MVDPDAVQGIAKACSDAAAASDPAVYLASYEAGVRACAIVCSMVVALVGIIAWSVR